MEPYDRINWKAIGRWALPIVLTTLLVAFLLARPLTRCQAVGYAFCNPTLWLLGQDHLMWEMPLHSPASKNISMGGSLLCLLSFFVHAAALIFSIIGLVVLWKNVFEERRRRSTHNPKRCIVCDKKIEDNKSRMQGKAS